MRWVLLFVAGCSFSARPALVGDGPGSNAGSDGATGQYCIGTFVKICSVSPPPQQLQLGSMTVINTDMDPRCLVVHQPGGPDVCAMFYDQVDVGANVAATGSRPLALAAMSSLTIGGVLDVSSKRNPALRGAGANTAPCDAGTLPAAASARLGAGGGAGGSVVTIGAGGGTGDIDGTGGIPGAALQPPTRLVGGCPGQDGAIATGMIAAATGGGGGGGLYLVAGGSITVGGFVAASGAGGNGAGHYAGGGGGGAGGVIVLEAPTITVNGTIVANGGGGGEGGDNNDNGNPGADGHVTDPLVAPGGGGAANNGGGGGDGANGTTLATPGNLATNGGGGGGGSVGYILAIGHAPTGNGTFSPPALVR